MTDFRNLETSTEYAIRGFYNYIYSFIPEEYRIQYKHNEAVDCCREFYDQELTVENRFKYKATKIEYVDRAKPWVAIMWNSEGLLPADNHFRKFPIKLPTDDGRYFKGCACYMKKNINLGIVSNSITALDEFQEVFWLNVRPDDCTISAKHPLIEEFNVNIMDFAFSSTTKLPRNDGTLAMTMGIVPIQFPVVGCIDTNTGIIKTINTYIKDLDTKINLTDFNISPKE